MERRGRMRRVGWKMVDGEEVDWDDAVVDGVDSDGVRLRRPYEEALSPVLAFFPPSGR